MTVKERIKVVVEKSPGIRLSDLARKLGKQYQHVRQEVRDMANRGEVRLEKTDFYRVYPTEVQAKALLSSSEAAIKARIARFLEDHDWEVTVRFGKTPGADIMAKRGKQTWLIEVKGMPTRRQMFNNYFLAALGTILQRMRQPKAHYSIAFPDHPVFRRLWAELPQLAKNALHLSALFVGDRIEEVR